MTPGDPPSRVSRLQRIVQLKALGFSDQEISDQMKEDGYQRVSEKTVSRIIHSSEADEIVETLRRTSVQVLEELKRNQLRDIAASTDERNRLEYRDRLLGKLLPRKIEARTEGTQQVEVRLGGEITDLLREFWAAAEQADKAEIETVRGNEPTKSKTWKGHDLAGIERSWHGRR